MIMPDDNWRDKQIMRLHRDPTYVHAHHAHRLMTLAADIRLDDLPLKFRGSIVGAASAIARIKDIVSAIKGSALDIRDGADAIFYAEFIKKQCNEIMSYIAPAQSQSARQAALDKLSLLDQELYPDTAKNNGATDAQE